MFVQNLPFVRQALRNVCNEMPTAPPTMLRNIQALRCIAAVWVMIFHMRGLTPFGFKLLPAALIDVFYAGVDIFFVISGFIMAENTRATRGGLREAASFLGRRFGRIYIGWWPFFVFYLAYYGLVRDGIRSRVDLWGSFFLWPQDVTQYLMAVTWTLSFELYFYLAVALLLAWSRRMVAPLLIVCATVVVVFNAWALVRGLYLPQNEALAKSSHLLPFYLSPLVLEFIAGFLLAEWLHRRPRVPIWVWSLGVMAFLAAAMAYQRSMDPGALPGFFHTPERVLLVGGFAVCLVALAVTLEHRGWVAGRTASTLGDGSYAFYLAHIAALHVADSFYAMVQPWLRLPNVLWGPLVIGAVFAFSWVFHRRYEQPLNARLKQVLNRLL